LCAGEKKVAVFHGKKRSACIHHGAYSAFGVGEQFGQGLADQRPAAAEHDDRKVRLRRFFQQPEALLCRRTTGKAVFPTDVPAVALVLQAAAVRHIPGDRFYISISSAVRVWKNAVGNGRKEMGEKKILIKQQQYDDS